MRQLILTFIVLAFIPNAYGLSGDIRGSNIQIVPKGSNASLLVSEFRTGGKFLELTIGVPSHHTEPAIIALYFSNTNQLGMFFSALTGGQVILLPKEVANQEEGGGWTLKKSVFEDSEVCQIEIEHPSGNKVSACRE